jgi:hypothetical protein
MLQSCLQILSAISACNYRLGVGKNSLWSVSTDVLLTPAPHLAVAQYLAHSVKIGSIAASGLALNLPVSPAAPA